MGEQDVAIPEQERASGQPQAAASSGSQGQPQAARGFPERTKVQNPKSGEMISVKRNQLHGLWSPCHSSVASDSEEGPTEQVPEVTEAEEEQGTEEEQWTE